MMNTPIIILILRVEDREAVECFSLGRFLSLLGRSARTTTIGLFVKREIF